MLKLIYVARNHSMNLLLVAHYFPLRGSGVFRAYDFVRFLEPLSVNISVVSRMNIRDVLSLRAEEHTGKTKIYRALSLDLLLAELVPDVFQITATFLVSFVAMVLNKVSIVIISVPPGVPAIGAFFAGKALRKKIVFDVRDKWEDHSIYFSRYMLATFTHVILKKLFNVFYRKANLVIGVTPSLVEYLKARGASKVALIPNGADAKLFYPRNPQENLAIRSELGLRPEDIVLVFAGGMGTGGYYRPDVVIQALANLGNQFGSKLKFIVMGRSDEPSTIEMQKLTKNLGLQNGIIFLGEQKRDYVARILSCCDIGVVPYDNNPLWGYAQPAKFFDYCASGLPIIATVFEGSELASLIRKYEVGYVVEPLNIAGFVSALRKFCKLSQKERRDMSERARSLVENSFDRLKIAKKLVETLQTV